ncbi:MAG: SDR family oxidoreductase [Polyangiaceae bacterium]
MNRALDGKVVLITGATEGVGKAAALELARQGAKLVLVGRNPEKTQRVVSEVQNVASHPVEQIIADMSSMADVRRVAKEFLAKHDRLDVLANNAGALVNDYILSADGFEMTFALNHMGYFLLTAELLNVLKKTPGARIISTSSGAHNSGRIDLETFVKRNGRAGFSAYTASKLANILFTRELARRIEGSGVVANCFHPGFVRTGFGVSNKDILGKAIGVVASIFGRTPEKGAETLVWLATSEEGGRVSGQYFFNNKVAKISKRAQDDVMAKKLWELSERLAAKQAS